MSNLETEVLMPPHGGHSPNYIRKGIRLLCFVSVPMAPIAAAVFSEPLIVFGWAGSLAGVYGADILIEKFIQPKT